MNKFLRLTVGLGVVGSTAFAGSADNSLQDAVNRMVNGLTHQSGNAANAYNLGQQSSGHGSGAFGTLMVAVPEPAGMAALTVAIGGLILRRRKSSRP